MKRSKRHHRCCCGPCHSLQTVRLPVQRSANGETGLRFRFRSRFHFRSRSLHKNDGVSVTTRLQLVVAGLT